MLSLKSSKSACLFGYRRYLGCFPYSAAGRQVFDKALGEPSFSGIYARLCYDLNQVLPSFKVMDEDGKEEDVEFRRVLLNKCQSEFEEGGAAMRAVEAREKRQQEEDAAKVVSLAPTPAFPACHARRLPAPGLRRLSCVMMPRCKGRQIMQQTLLRFQILHRGMPSWRTNL